MKTFGGKALFLDRADINTDEIIPAKYLTEITKEAMGPHLLEDLKLYGFDRHRDLHGVRVVVSRENFGCGSSREHAPWALDNYGIRCILAPSYADIFYNNCFNNGMLPIVLPTEKIEQLFQEVRAQEGYQLTVDLPSQTITTPSGEKISFELQPFLKERLLNGWDQIGLTLLHEDKISAYEAAHA
jgi:3-isopropylmalate/(R)-2-methylmalate dehydratase small subunit